MSEVLNPELSNEHAYSEVLESQEAVDKTFYALVESLDSDIETREALSNVPFLHKPEAPGDLMAGRL